MYHLGKRESCFISRIGETIFKNFMNFCFMMDDLFSKIKVEVVTKNGLSPFIGPYILKEVEYVKI